MTKEAAHAPAAAPPQLAACIHAPRAAGVRGATRRTSSNAEAEASGQRTPGTPGVGSGLCGRVGGCARACVLREELQLLSIGPHSAAAAAAAWHPGAGGSSPPGQQFNALCPCAAAPAAPHALTPACSPPSPFPGGARGSETGGGGLSPHWGNILRVFDALLDTLRANHVPPFLVRKLFEQLFSFVNVQVSGRGLCGGVVCVCVQGVCAFSFSGVECCPSSCASFPSSSSPFSKPNRAAPLTHTHHIPPLP